MKHRLLKIACLATLLASFVAFSACSSGNGSATQGGDKAAAAAVVSPGDIVISEVVSSNSTSLSDPVAGTPDWLELHNTTDHDINIAGFGLSDNARKLYKYTFTDAVIPADGYLLVYCAQVDSEAELSVQATGFGISKGGDTLYLTDGYYTIIQQLDVPALSTDVSYARGEDGTYSFCATPTPGVANDAIVTTEKLEELFTAASTDALAITEVCPGDDPWMEIKNISRETVRLSDYFISDKASNLTKFQLPDQELKAGGYVVVYLAGNKEPVGDRIDADFRLSSKDDHLFIANRDGEKVSELSWGVDIEKGLSVVATEDGTAMYTAFPTPGADNSTEIFSNMTYTDMDDTDAVRITEALRRNKYSITDADGDREPWVELHNGSSEAVSLKGYYLSDSEKNPTKWALPEITIPAGGYIIIFLDGDVEGTTDSEYHAPFSLSAGETIYLTRLAGLRRDSLPVPADISENISVGRNENGAIRYYTKPTPGYENAYGYETADSLGCFNSKSVFISEVCAAHEIKVTANDWVELYNGSSETVNLSGWYLSNSDSNPYKYQIPSGTSIGAGEHLVIEATSHTSRQKKGVATFGISPTGDTICLSDANGLRVDTFRTGALSASVTSGRLEGDKEGKRVFFTVSTKGKQNSTSLYRGYVAQPVFSETKLYQKETFSLSMTCATPGAVIRYTTNGSKPTSSSKVYEGPITISKNTVVKAAAYEEGLLASPITTYTYLFENEHTLPVVSLSGSPENIKAVFAAKNNKTKVEREAYISWYEVDGRLGTEFPCGIKAKGAGTVTYAQKSLAIHLRGGYGQSSVKYPFFDYGDVDTFSSLVLRNSGQDFGDHSYDARVRDSFASRAAVGLNLDYAMTRPVIVYINGSYYGIYDFNEDLNKDYLAAHYGVDTDAVDIIKRNTTVLKGSNTDIKRVFNYATSRKMSDDAVFEEFSQWIDVAYFTDYFIAQTYFSNSDMFNQKYWRSQDYKVKWRPIYYDLDFAAANTYKRNIISAYFNEDGVPSHDGSLTHMDIYVGLRRNAKWRAYAAERYVQVVMQYYNPERLLGILDDLVGQMEPEMKRHISKWNKPHSMSDWKNAVESLRTFIRKRPDVALSQMADYFKISSTQLEEWKAKYSS